MRNKIIFSFLGLFLFLGVIRINALDSVLQSPDILDVSEPIPNSRIKGTVNIVWKMYDNDQNVIPYTINLFDSQTCNVTDYGRINQNPNGVSSTTQNNVVSWNTKSTLSNSNISDGNYCLKICVGLKNGSNPYSACNSRNIRIINNNRLPVITSVPSNLTIYENETWKYQIVANDPDGDKLTYRFVIQPAFLDINSQTGLVASNGKNKNPGGNLVSKYTVKVSVDDNFSGAVTQQFDLTVKKVTSIPENPGEVIPPTPPVDDNDPTVISILSPTAGQEVENEVLIKWDIKDKNGISKVLLEYSNDREAWTKIGEISTPTTSEYLWNLQGIELGEYYLRIKVTDTLGSETLKVSNSFIITTSDKPEEPTESNVLIINTSPVNDAEINNNSPEISGEFIPSEEAKIDPSTFEIFLDDENITNQCIVNQEGFNCRLTSELSEGLHKVKISVKDTNNNVANNEWTFSVIGDEPPVSNPVENGISAGTIVLIAIICIIIFLLIVIPWIIYSLWYKKNRTNILVKNENDEENKQAMGEYGYYLPPYNPVPIEPLVQGNDPLQEYNSSFTKEFTNNAELTQAEPQMDLNRDDTDPVLPNQDDNLAQSETTQGVNNERDEENPMVEIKPESNIEKTNQEIRSEAEQNMDLQNPYESDVNSPKENNPSEESSNKNLEKNESREVEMTNSVPIQNEANTPVVTNPNQQTDEFVEPTPVD